MNTNPEPRTPNLERHVRGPRNFRASWLLPMSGPPIRDGYVTVEDGYIIDVGGGDSAHQVSAASVALLPALVNAHTHLELSYLHGRVPPREQFVDWIRTVIATRRTYPDPADPVILSAAREAVAQARRWGTGLVGDVSNTLVTVPLMREGGLPGRVFHELLGFSAPDPAAVVAAARARIAEHAGADDRVRIAVAPHAPYSVSPGLFAAIAAELATDAAAISSVHLGESPAEVEFLRSGSGDFRRMLEDVGVWTDAWVVPEASPVAYLSRVGLLDRRVLAVHGVQFGNADLALLAQAGATLVTCPRSNVHVGVGAPPVSRFYAAGVDVAVGTDSLASAPDLNLFAELAEMRRLAPDVPAGKLLESATRLGARALGFGDDFGTIEPGKQAALIEVALPAGVTDVEEYLVGGTVTAGQIRWVGDASGAVPPASPR